MYGSATFSQALSFFFDSVSTLKNIFFSNGSEYIESRSQPIGFDQLVTRKAFWVNQQREGWLQLVNEANTKILDDEYLLSALDSLEQKLGTNLGSPAVHTIELLNLKRMLSSTFPDYARACSILHKAQAIVESALVKDPKLALACYRADVRLLIEEYDLTFINSGLGRDWLIFYRPFLSAGQFKVGLNLIVSHAIEQFAELRSDTIGRTTSLSSAELEAIDNTKRSIASFQAWSEHILERRPRRVKVVTIDLDSTCITLAKTEKLETSSTVGRFAAVKRAISLSAKVATRYPIIYGALAFSIRAVAAFSGQTSGQTVVEDHSFFKSDFHLIDEGLPPWGLTSQISSPAHLRRYLEQEHPDSCVTGVVAEETWAQTLGREGNELVHGVAVGPQGQIVVFGVTDSFGDFELFVAQYASSGELQWAQSLGGSGSDFGVAVAINADNEVVLTGHTSSFGAGSNDVILVKYHYSGELLWAKTIGNGGDNSAVDIAFNDAGQIFIVGDTNNFSGTGRDVLLASLESDGSVSWIQHMVAAENDAGVSITMLPGGDLIVAISSGSYRENFGDEMVVARLGAGGLPKWVKAIGGGLDQDLHIRDTALHPDGSIIIVGEHNSFDDGFVGSMLLLKISDNGEILGQHYLGNNGDFDSATVSIDTLGQIIVAGGVSAGAGGRSMLLVKYAADLSIVWVKTQDNGGEASNAIASVDPSGLIIFAGVVERPGGSDFEAILFRLSMEAEVNSLASGFEFTDVNLESISPPEGLTISDRTIAPVFENVTTSLSSGAISSPDIRYFSINDALALSLIANQTAFAGIRDPILTMAWDFTIPPNAFIGLPEQPTITADTFDIPWLSYDSLLGRLFGTPLGGAAGQQSIPLSTISNLGVSGIVAANLQLNLCVTNFDRQRLQTWAQTMGGSGIDFGAAIAVQNDGSVVVLGYTESFGASVSNTFLAGFSFDGQLLWANTINGAAFSDATALAVGIGGEIVVGGGLVNTDTSVREAWIARYDSNGQNLWARSLNISFRDQIGALVVDSDGSIFVAGTTTPGFSASTDGLLASLNSDGTLRWMRSFDSGDSDEFSGIAIDAMGRIVVVGHLWSGGFSNDLILARFYSNGQIEWMQTLGGGDFEQGKALDISEAGNIIVAGQSADRNLLVANYDTNGGLVWAKEFGGSSEEEGFGVKISSQEIVLVGNSQSFGAGSRDALIARVGFDGELISAKAIGGEGSDEFTSIAVGQNGSVILTGNTASFGVGRQDVLLVKADNSGNIIAHAELNQQDIISATLSDLAPVITNITLGVDAFDWPTPTITNVDSSPVPQDFQLDSIGPAYFNNYLPVEQLVEFSSFFEMGFRDYFYSSASVVSISSLGQASLPGWLSFDFAAQILQGTPVGDVRGEYPINILVEQQGNLQSVTFILNVLNTPPVYVGNTTFERTTGRFVIPLAQFFIDAQGDRPGSYAFAQINGNLPNPLASVDPFSGQMFGSAFTGDQGEYEFNVTASDPFDGSGWAILALHIANTPPAQRIQFANPPPITIGSDALSYSFSDTAFLDPDNDPIVYQVISTASFIHFDTAIRLLSGQPGPADRGIHPVQIIASDPYHGETNVTIIVDVNAAPEGADVSTLITSPVGQYFAHSFAGQFSDQDGDLLGFRLVESAASVVPEWFSINPSSQNYSGVPTGPNTHAPFQLLMEVSDGRGGFKFHTITVTIPNSPPVLMTPFSDQILSVNQVRTLLVPTSTFSDLDGDPLSYTTQVYAKNSSRSVRSGMVSGVANVLTFSTRSGDQGQYELLLSANDGFGGQSSMNISLVVSNLPPELAYPVPTPEEGHASTPYSFSIEDGNFLDPDGDPLDYFSHLESGEALPLWLRFDPLRRAYFGTPAGQDRGALPVKLNVVDITGASTSAVFNITVVNSEPFALRPLRQQTVSQLEERFEFFIEEMSDQDGDPLSYTAAQVDRPLPEWITFTSNNLRFVVFPRRAPRSGNFPLIVTVDDSHGGVRSEAFDLTIQAPPSEQASESSLFERLAFVWPLVVGTAVFLGVGMAIAWRGRRITRTNAKLAALAKQFVFTSTNPASVQRLEAARNETKVAIRQFDGTQVDDLIERVEAFGETFLHYTAHHPSLKAVEGLRLHKLFKELFRMIRGQLNNRRLAEKFRYNLITHRKIYAMNLLIDFLTLAVSMQYGLLDEQIERKWLDKIDDLRHLVESVLVGVEFFGVGYCGCGHSSLQRIQFVYALQTLREAAVYVPDTSTLLGVLRQSLFHLLSPSKLVNDLKFVVYDIPSPWYLHVLEAKLTARSALLMQGADVQCQAVTNLQRRLTNECTKSFLRKQWYSADWRLLYSAIEIYTALIRNPALPDQAKQQLIQGADGKKPRLLGLMQLAEYTQIIFKAQARWVREAAKDALRQLANDSSLNFGRLLETYRGEAYGFVNLHDLGASPQLMPRAMATPPAALVATTSEQKSGDARPLTRHLSIAPVHSSRVHDSLRVTRSYSPTAVVPSNQHQASIPGAGVYDATP